MDRSYKDLFFAESQEYLKEINKSLVRIEKNPEDMDAINVIFRLMHTLKGMAATMGYKELASLAHGLEDSFDSLRSGRIKLNADIMDVVFECVDGFNILSDDFKEERPVSIDVTVYLQKIGKIIPPKEDKKYSGEITPVKAEEVKVNDSHVEDLRREGRNIFLVEIQLKEDCPMKGVRSFLVLERIKKMGEIIKVSPSEDILQREEFKDSFKVKLATMQNQEAIHKELLGISDVEKIDISLEEAEILEKAKEKVSFQYLKKVQSMRIPVRRLDKIMNFMGELAIAKSRLVQTVQSKDYSSLEETAYLIDRLVSSLRDETLKLRLLPISYILDNFPRIVRDLARDEGKEIDLKISGSEIELDRVILDEMGDPLIHIIRNSIDHGIELSNERERLGKNRRGKIFINVFREKGHIIIEISDDGKGIDFNKIAKIAVERGVIGCEEAGSLDIHKVLDIISLPGFTEKDKVSEISGRGVGLDVVKTKLDTLGGRLDLETEAGKGTKFILTLPLTLAIIKAMLVSIGEQIFAVPLMSIRETVKVKENDVRLIKDIEVIRLREEIIPIVRLDKEFGIEVSKKEEDMSIVIVEGRVKGIGLVVSKVVGEQDIVVKPLGSLVRKVKGVSGATILGNGRVALILDVVNLV